MNDFAALHVHVYLEVVINCGVYKQRCGEALHISQSTHRVAMTDFWRTFHRDGKISPGWWGGRMHAHLPPSIPFHSIYHHVQSCSERSSWEGRYTPPISSLFLYVLSALCTRGEGVQNTDVKKDRVPTLNGIFPQLCWRKGEGVMFCTMLEV
jgi:hypothetical protein